ncbi:MAG: HAMP domain-containing protein [Clostridia bacterium]|nr:HAMP domain-containing protein [Clostridia bacterium]
MKKLSRRNKYFGKQSRSSIYFLLWSIFTALSAVIVLSFGVMQHFLREQTYKDAAANVVAEKGKRIEREILNGLPSSFGNNFSGFLRYLSDVNDVDVLLLNEDGDVLFPIELNVKPDDPALKEHLDYSAEMKTLLKEMDKQEATAVVFEGDGEYVYGSKIALFGDSVVYLYAAKSIDLVSAVSAQMGVRTVLLAVFVFILAFVVASAVSGWLTKSISEITEKARQLAQGDFNVDFHGTDYGKELTELADALNFARDELSKTDRMQKEIIANVSHDFRTPLTMIKAYASMIMEISGEIPEKRNKHAQVIVDEADRLTSLVNDILDLSKLRSDLDVMELDEVDMSTYTLEVLERFAYLKETQGYVFLTDIDKGLYTRCDELKIGQVLYNLIGNAVNYTGENKRVLIGLKEEQGGVFRFAVTDTGKGIKPEELSAVWDRYYRSSEMHKRPVKGMGLGLSIVKTILEKHGFVFGVNSEPGKGSTFYVLFPLTRKVDGTYH